MPLSRFREWSPDDQAVAVALVLEEWDTCAGCGHPLSVSTDVASDGTYRAVEHLCFGCEVRERRAAKTSGPGLLITAVSRDE